MLPFLVLIHAALGVGMVGAARLPEQQRHRAVIAAGSVGAAAGLWLFVARGSRTTWGTFAMDDAQGAAAGAAVFCAWLLVMATDDAAGRWNVAALVGAASAALIGFALNDWIAPALLFWICVSAATVVGAARADRSGWSPVLVGLSDACVVAALVTWALQEQVWTMPERLDGWAFYAVVGGLSLRAGALPRMGAWELAAGGTTALIPLLIGSVFALVPAVSDGAEVGVALPLLLAGMLSALWCAIRSPQVVLIGGWLVGTMLALALIEPGALGKAASAATLTATAVLLWPWAGGRAGPERGLLVAAVPLTVGFGPIVGGAIASFDRASTAETVVESAPWMAFAALLPAALALGVTVGAAIARRTEAETYRPAAVLATWAVAAVALILGLTGGAAMDFDLDGELWLYVVAAAVAAAAARFAPRQPVRSDETAAEPVLGLLSLSPSISRPVAALGVGLVGASFLTTLGFTYVGLKTGFL